ncbi:ExbD/TolR family protein [Psychroserpens damuponensis]|uniref:ExbD/TolR family protein n=1 Tax=Psychroserpens damuponensis TaxID=943936 RepID=UPI00059014C6|nr:biopolymer transporter ExbD [Psychroserpens damuponensis]
MKSTRRHYPEVNAGSMADIAFLLLIFFLVTAVIPKDKGINRKLPAPCPENVNCNDGHVNMRNILVIKVNASNELLVDNELISINELKTITKTFLNNNGDSSCDYCDGLNDISSSDNPQKAIVSLANDTLTSYEFYIKVQDEITKAYYELRRDYAKNKWNKPTNELSIKELQEVKKAYPFKLSEAEIKH